MTKMLAFAVLIGGSSAIAGLDRSRSMTDEEIDRSFGDAAPSRGAKSQHESLAKWRAGILTNEGRTHDEQIDYLGTALRKTSKENIFQVHERFEIYDLAQQRMTSIPGHAEYYRDKILAAQEDVKAHLDDRLISIRLVKYMDEQMYAFQTLEHVPSTENVRVLGELLFNDWNGDLTVQEGMQLPRLCLGAVCAMGNLPLVRKPFRETQGHQAQEQLEGWRQWYQEIKDGKRTFRFEGDPTEYDLNGPAPKEKLERLALASRMDKDRAARHGGADAATNPELPASSITPLIALILAAGTVIVSMAWYFRRAAAR